MSLSIVDFWKSLKRMASRMHDKYLRPTATLRTSYKSSLNNSRKDSRIDFYLKFSMPDGNEILHWSNRGWNEAEDILLHVFSCGV